MGKQLSRGVVALLTLIALAACGGGSHDSGLGVIDWPEGGRTGAAPGDLAPNFRLQTAEGGEIVLAEQTGRPVVVNFLASWCANCMEEMGALQAVHATGVSVIGVNLREKAEVVSRLKTESGATFPIGLDATGRVTRAFKIVNLPGTVVLRADGTIARVFRGPITEESLLEAVREAEGG